MVEYVCVCVCGGGLLFYLYLIFKFTFLNKGKKKEKKKTAGKKVYRRQLLPRDASLAQTRQGQRQGQNQAFCLKAFGDFCGTQDSEQA